MVETYFHLNQSLSERKLTIAFYVSFICSSSKNSDPFRASNKLYLWLFRKVAVVDFCLSGTLLIIFHVTTSNSSYTDNSFFFLFDAMLMITYEHLLVL